MSKQQPKAGDALTPSDPAPPARARPTIARRVAAEPAAREADRAWAPTGALGPRPTTASPGAPIVHADQVGRARSARPSPEALDAAVTLCRAFGDRTRLGIALALAAAGELCVSDLAAVVEVSESAVSHSLRTLRQLRVVRYRKRGKVAYYALISAWTASPLGAALLAGALVRDPADAPSHPRRPGRGVESPCTDA